MNFQTAKQILFNEIAAYKQRKKDSPYWQVNYKRPLKGRQIIERI